MIESYSPFFLMEMSIQTLNYKDMGSILMLYFFLISTGIFVLAKYFKSTEMSWPQTIIAIFILTVLLYGFDYFFK
ncbi:MULTISPECIES: hypothetical protein [Bacillaceae]|uniref:Uncharacterized protein n=1 Tax=Evansella alkalicola TaxID=745819 RepID=A0ABS6JN24_9BACI|nr:MULTISPECIES: hypothetical protein [Bacillaceae]MBU9719964.1 hypothetical protein [Bacillus alkalicola]